MNSKLQLLLSIDGIVNLALGLLLACFPERIIAMLGAPPAASKFYPSILGAVLVGIGIALFLEYFGEHRNFKGLGLGGAIAINLCGALMLVGWLLSGTLHLPTRGYIVLWGIAALVLVIGVVEICLSSAMRFSPHE